MSIKRKVGYAGFSMLALCVLAVWSSGLLTLSGGKNATAAGSGQQGIVPSAFPDPVPDCPATFAQCDNTFGRRCNFSTMCTMTNTGLDKCKKPTGGNFNCPGSQTIWVQNCPCRDVFHMTCCDDETCGPCPTCESQPGSQTYFCL